MSEQETIPAPLERLDKIDQRLGEGDQRMGRFEQGLAHNTETTVRTEGKVDDLTESVAGLVEAWGAMSGAWKVFNFVGKAAKPLTYIIGLVMIVWGAIVSIKSGTPPPTP